MFKEYLFRLEIIDSVALATISIWDATDSCPCFVIGFGNFLLPSEGSFTMRNCDLQTTFADSLFGILIASAVHGCAIYRDLEIDWDVCVRYPISKFAYFMGRFWRFLVPDVYLAGAF